MSSSAKRLRAALTAAESLTSTVLIGQSAWVLLVRHYSLVTSAELSRLDLPLEFGLGDGRRAVITQSDSDVELLVEHPVEGGVLRVVDSGWSRTAPDGTVAPVPGIDVGRWSDVEQLSAEDVASVVSFVLDTAVTVAARIHADRVVAETDDEKALLARLGTDMPAVQTSGRAATRTFNVTPTPLFFTAVLRSRVGVRLSADALRNHANVGRFRELWRVLESAFGCSDDELVDALSQYPPALEIGYDRGELAAQLVLRGRASHASSRAEVGLVEMINVRRECDAQVARLKCLVERVILTKRTWGQRTTAVDELLPLQAYVGRGSELVYIR